MLSGEGNEIAEKTTIGLISKKATLHLLHTFLVHFLAFVLHDYNFQKLLSYTFFGENVVRVLVHFFFHCRLFSPCIGGLAFPILSPPLQNFHVVLPTKSVSFVFFFYLSL